MKKLLLPLTAVATLGTASAATFPTNTTPPWKSYMATGNAADIVASTTVAAAIGTKVDATSGQSLNQTLQTPTITGGTESGVDISANIIIPTGASNSVTTANLSRRASVFPDDYKISSDGTDDAPSIQRAANALCSSAGSAGSGGIISLEARVYEIHSAITIPCAIAMYGQGWEEQLTLGGGSWLHITSALGTTAAFTLSSTLSRASQFSNFAITQDHPTPSTTASTAWTPTTYGYVFNLNGVGAAVFFNHILFDGVYTGIYANGAGRVELSGIYADVFNSLLRIDGSEDVDRVRDVHVWPYWTNSTESDGVTPTMTTAQQNNVETYRIANTNALIINRADTPFFDEIFGIGLHSLFEFGATTTGNTGVATKVHAGRVSCDKSEYCVWVDNTTTAQVTGIFDQIDYQGENPVTGDGTPNSGGAMIEVNGQSEFQVGQMYGEIIGSSVVSLSNTSVCSEMHISGLRVNMSDSPSSANIFYMPQCSSTAYHLIDLLDYSGDTTNAGGGTTTIVNGVGHLMMPTLTEKNSSAQ